MSEHFVHEWVTARKPHVCQLCRRAIRAGERYQRCAGMDGATAWTWRECAHCDSIRNLAVDGDYDMDSVAEWQPSTVAQTRALVLWRRQWTRKDGSLYPVPQKVWHEDRDGFGWQVDVTWPAEDPS